MTHNPTILRKTLPLYKEVHFIWRGQGTMEKVRDLVREGKRVAKEDPRRVVHSFKVGLVLSLVSSFYYYQPLYDSFGVNAMWAVMTVVVVFEFSVGATLGKGLNRVAATLFAGALGIGAHHLASLSGSTGEPILLAIFVFIQAALSTELPPISTGQSA